MTTQREQFEAWVCAQYKPGSAMLGRDLDGDYINSYTMREWAAWQAAQAQQAAVEPKGLFIDLIAQHPGLAGELKDAVELVEFKQFLSDVHTAAGLIEHGKQSKALGKRLADGVMKYMATPSDTQAVTRLTDERIRKLWASENGLEDMDLCKLDDFAQTVKYVERELLGDAE